MINKKVLILIAVLVLLIILLLLVEFFGAKKPEQATSIDAPESNTNQSPLPSAITSTPFNLVSQPQNLDNFGVADRLTFTFSKPIKPSEIKYSLTPQTPINAKVEPSGMVLIFEPTQTWEFNTQYKLIIYKDLTSVDNQTLPEDIKLDFTTSPYSGI
jgi:hypothetical protein